MKKEIYLCHDSLTLILAHDLYLIIFLAVPSILKKLDDSPELAYYMYESHNEDRCCTKTFYEINVRHNTCFRVSIAIYMTVTGHTVWTRDNV